MKASIAVLVLMMSLPSLAFVEVDCHGTNSENQTVRFEVEESWGGSIRDARLYTYVEGETRPEETTYRLFNNRPQAGRLIYSGQGARLTVDLFPDRVPRWGRSYRGQLSLPDSHANLNCRFPQVRP